MRLKKIHSKMKLKILPMKMHEIILTVGLVLFYSLFMILKVTAKNYNHCKFETIFSIHQTYSIIYFTNVPNLKQIDTKCTIYSTNKLDIIIYPSHNLILDSSLRLSNLRLLYNSSFYMRLKLANFKGFDLNNKEFNLLTSKNSKLMLELDIYYSIFSLYSNQSNKCEQFQHVNHKLFGKINNFILRKTVNFKQDQICIYAFKNAHINLLSVMSNENSFLNRNIFQFRTQNYSLKNANLNSNIWSLYMSNFRIDLTTKILNEYVFKDLSLIYLAGTLNSIQLDLFGYFPRLSAVFLDLSDARRFFHTIKLDWLNAINKDQVSFKLIGFLVRINLIAYEFPEEDFCLFNKFPFYRMIYSLVVFDRVVNNCSCTLLWLTQLQQKTKYKLNFTLSFAQANYILNEDHTNFSRIKFEELRCLNFLETFRICDYSKRISKCNLTNYTNDFFLIPDYYELNYFLNYLKFLNNIIIQPLLCFISFGINILSYLVITNKNKKEIFKHEFCAYMKYYFVLNVFLSVLFQFKLINMCLGYTSVYCSSIRTSYVTQYLYIVMQYLTKVLKFCSNFCLLMVSFSRYQMFSSNNTKVISIKRVKVIIGLSFLVSLLINFSKLFEYKIVNVKKLEGNTMDYPLFKINPIVCDFTGLGCFILYFLDLIGDLMNDIICFVCNTIIDILLVIFLRNKINESETNLFNKKQTIRDLLKMRFFNFREKYKGLKNNRKNVVYKLAISTFLNGVIVLITRLPETMSFILNLVAKLTQNQFCYVFSDCSILMNLTDCFYLISFMLIFFTNLMFNENFKNSFKQMVHLDRRSIFKKLILL